MAVTIVQTPELYAPTYNPMVYTLSSTTSANDEFKYVADIYIAGAVAYAVRLTIAPEPLTGTRYGIINISEVVENWVSQNIGDPTGQVATTPNDESITDYIVKFGEQWASGGVLTVYPDLTSDTSRFAWNGSIAYEDFVGFSYVPYYLANQDTYFLSNSPATIKTMLTNSHWLYYFDSNNPNITDWFNLVTYDAAGSTLGTWRMNNTLTFADTGEYMGKVAAGPYNIGQLPNTEFSFGVQPVFTGAEASYSIQAVGTAGGGQHSERKTFTIVDPCNFQRWNILFLNRLGGFDTFTFNMLSRDSNEIQKTFYKKNPNRLSSAGAYTFSLADREKATFFTKSTRKRVLNSDWITEDVSEWLEELLSSPVVYLEDASNNLVAVNLTNKKWTKKTKLNDKLFNLQIEIDLNDNYRQRG